MGKCEGLFIGNNIIGGVHDSNGDKCLGTDELKEAIIEGQDLLLFTSTPRGMNDEQILQVFSNLPVSSREKAFLKSSCNDRAAFITRFSRYLGPDQAQKLVQKGIEFDRLPPEKKRIALLDDLEAMGRHTERSKIVGIHIDVFKHYTHFALTHPAFLRFGNALYFNNSGYPGKSFSDENSTSMMMIPSTKKYESNVLAERLYKQYCQQQGIKSDRQFQWTTGFRGGVTYIHNPSPDDLQNAWNLEILVDREGVSTNTAEMSFYTPPYLVALHELAHAERTELYEKEHTLKNVESCIHEIGPTLELVILQDEVFKEVNQINPMAEVNYPKKLPISHNKKGINLGLIANTFRDLKKKYGTIEAALMSSEGRHFVSKYYN